MLGKNEILQSLISDYVSSAKWMLGISVFLITITFTVLSLKTYTVSIFQALSLTAVIFLFAILLFVLVTIILVLQVIKCHLSMKSDVLTIISNEEEQLRLQKEAEISKDILTKQIIEKEADNKLDRILDVIPNINEKATTMVNYLKFINFFFVSIIVSFSAFIVSYILG
jgi:signal transduction histidine kinase